jgi:phosphoglycolate phosphatase
MAHFALSDEYKFGFIFDLDGTLIDSGGQIARAVNKTLDARGETPRPEDDILKHIGLPAFELFNHLALTESETEEIVSEFRLQLSLEINDSNVAFEDALQFIRKLKSENRFVGVATSKPTDLAMLVIHNSDYRRLVDYVIGIGIYEPKPNPGMIRDILTKFNFTSGVMFGDRPEDMSAALKAGINAIGIAQSAFTKEELVLAGAKRAFSNFSELMIDYENSGAEIIDYFS